MVQGDENDRHHSGGGGHCLVVRAQAAQVHCMNYS